MAILSFKLSTGDCVRFYGLAPTVGSNRRAVIVYWNGKKIAIRGQRRSLIKCLTNRNIPVREAETIIREYWPFLFSQASGSGSGWVSST